MRLAVRLAALGLLLPTLAAAEATVSPVKQTALVAISSEATLSASPARVFAMVCSARGFGTIAGFASKNPAFKFTRVGDHVRASIWGDDGTLVCSGFVAGKELRVYWEPDKGHYLCHKLVRVEASGKGSKMTMLDRYSDDNMAEAAKTAEKVREETAKGWKMMDAIISN